jgi:hypothetical protein
MFIQSHAFSSTSAAGAICNGRATAGRIAWKVKGTGQTYKDSEAANLEEPSVSSLKWKTCKTKIHVFLDSQSWRDHARVSIIIANQTYGYAISSFTTP